MWEKPVCRLAFRPICQVRPLCVSGPSRWNSRFVTLLLRKNLCTRVVNACKCVLIEHNTDFGLDLFTFNIAYFNPFFTI